MGKGSVGRVSSARFSIPEALTDSSILSVVEAANGYGGAKLQTAVKALTADLKSTISTLIQKSTEIRAFSFLS